MAFLLTHCWLPHRQIGLQVDPQPPTMDLILHSWGRSRLSNVWLVRWLGGKIAARPPAGSIDSFRTTSKSHFQTGTEPIGVGLWTTRQDISRAGAALSPSPSYDCCPHEYKTVKLYPQEEDGGALLLRRARCSCCLGFGSKSLCSANFQQTQSSKFKTAGKVLQYCPQALSSTTKQFMIGSS